MVGERLGLKCMMSYKDEVAHFWCAITPMPALQCGLNHLATQESYPQRKKLAKIKRN